MATKAEGPHLKFGPWFKSEYHLRQYTVDERIKLAVVHMAHIAADLCDAQPSKAGLQDTKRLRQS
jgi:hypothetical protein